MSSETRKAPVRSSPPTSQHPVFLRVGCRLCQSTEGKITTGRESVKSELKGSVKEPNMFRNYETEKITRKAGDVAIISSCLVLPHEIVMHDASFNVIL